MPRSDEPVPPLSVDEPIVSETDPGLGRRSPVLEQQRRASGGLSDDSPENPVRDSNPIRVTRTSK